MERADGRAERAKPIQSGEYLLLQPNASESVPFRAFGAFAFMWSYFELDSRYSRYFTKVDQ